MSMSMDKLVEVHWPQELLTTHKLVHEQHLVIDVLNAMPHWVLILDEMGRIVFGNKALLDSFRLKSDETILGLRNGDLLGCVNVAGNAAECGKTDFCRFCGAAQATATTGQSQANDMQECRITAVNKSDIDAYDLRVFTSPMELNGRKFTLFSINDISDEKRRKALESIFFHDVLNTAGSIRSILTLLEDADDEDRQSLYSMLPKTTNRLIDEIAAQRELVKAEQHELVVNTKAIRSQVFINHIAELGTTYDSSHSKKVLVSTPLPSLVFMADPVILGRVLTNMVKNALEASQNGDIVTITLQELNGTTLHFEVNNRQVMPKETQMQVFKRSYSTKGTNRGLGTYSMRLLTERYLGGKVGFISNEAQGTTFWVEIPYKTQE